jgi:hypothetical protein
MAYIITSVSQTSDGTLTLLMHDPVTKNSFVAPVPSAQPGFPVLIIVLTRPFPGLKRRRKRRKRW